METKFDPKAKVSQGQLSDAADGKQPNRESMNIDFNRHAPGKYKSANYLLDNDMPTKSGSEHVQDNLFAMADKKDY
jgi:hypothetical protein